MWAQVAGPRSPGWLPEPGGAAARGRRPQMRAAGKGVCRRRGRWKMTSTSSLPQITPNKYLEERIFTSIVSKDELADAASPRAGVHPPQNPPARALHIREALAEDHHIPDVCKISAGADRDHPLRPFRRAGQGRVQGLSFRVWCTMCRPPAARFSSSRCRRSTATTSCGSCLSQSARRSSAS